jgi:hypothetical protein
MISKKILDQLLKMAYPGITIMYSELANKLDTKTITDEKGELANAISRNNSIDMSLIIQAIYANSRYKGRLVDDKGRVKLVDMNGKIYELRVINTGSVLKITDTLNNKLTTIEYKASYKKEIKISLQEQILTQLKKSKMTDREVIEFIRAFEKNIK